MSTPSTPVTILPSHMSFTSDGTPVLRASRGRDARFAISMQAPAAPAERSSAGFSDGEKTTSTEALMPHAELSGGSSGYELVGSSAPFSALKSSSMHHWLAQGLQVRCSAPGCDFTTSQKEMISSRHSEICPRVMVACPHREMGCRAIVPRADLDAHLRTCPLDACASFMRSTIQRLSDLEAENRALRGEVRAVSSSVRWLEVSQPQQCAHCAHLFFDTDAIAHASEPTHVSPGLLFGGRPPQNQTEKSAANMESKEKEVKPAANPCKDVCEELAASGADARGNESTAGGQWGGRKCARGNCAHRVDELWRAEWRQQKRRFLLGQDDANTNGCKKPRTPFDAFLQVQPLEASSYAPSED